MQQRLHILTIAKLIVIIFARVLSKAWWYRAGCDECGGRQSLPPCNNTERWSRFKICRHTPHIGGESVIWLTASATKLSIRLIEEQAETHTQAHTPLPTSCNSPSSLIIFCKSVWRDQPVTKQENSTVYECQKPIHSPPLSLQIHVGTSYRTWRSEIPKNCSSVQKKPEDKPVPERMDEENRGVTEPTSSLFLHMKIDKKPKPHQSNRLKKKRKRWSRVFSWCWTGCYCPQVSEYWFPL